MSQLAAPSRPLRQPRPARSTSHPARPATRPAGRSARGAARVRAGSSAVAVTREKSSGPGFALLVATVVLLSALSLLLLNTLRAEQSFTLGKLRGDVTTTKDREQALQSELSAVSSPEALAIKAESMGMKKAGSVKFIDRSTGKSLGVATPSGGAASISVDTSPDTPASRAAQDVLNTSGIGSQISDPVARAAAKAKADAAKKTTEAKAAQNDEKKASSAPTSPTASPKATTKK